MVTTTVAPLQPKHDTSGYVNGTPKHDTKEVGACTLAEASNLATSSSYSMRGFSKHRQKSHINTLLVVDGEV